MRSGGVEAGILTGSATGEGGASLVEIGIWNHFGTERTTKDGTVEHIPARPWLQKANDEKSKEWAKTVARINKLMAEGKIDAARAAGILGADMQADIQQVIIDLRDPPNAESTIKAKKGKDNPLINTEDLKGSIKWAESK